MMARRGLLRSVLGGAIAAGLGSCDFFRGGNRYRFRMTVEVDTPDGLKTGSSVYEVTARKLHAYTSEEAERSAGVRGEAVVVDLPGGPLFVTLKTADAPWPNKYDSLAQLSMAALDKDFHNDWVESAERIASSWSMLRAEVPRKSWPIMVRFGEADAPNTVEKVDPHHVGVKRIILETTNDDVTTGIVARLSWLSDGGLTLDPASGPTISPTFAQTIRQRDFSTEMSHAK